MTEDIKHLPHALLARLTNLAILSVMEAGELLKTGYGTSFKIDSKESRHDLVTEYDKLSEKMIIKRIQSQFPDHGFLSEESGHTGKKDNTVYWILDPLDGTVNFAYGIPCFSISLAATFQNEILCGVVFAPLFHELFVAEKGYGAFLNGRKISCSKVDLLADAHVAFGIPSTIHKKPTTLFDQISAMAKLGLPIRRLGSAAIDLSYVACGRFDAFWEPFLHPWDVAAGKLILEEAGGKFTHQNGKPFAILEGGDVAATNGHIHEQFLSHINACSS